MPWMPSRKTGMLLASESTLVNSFSDLKENVASAAVYQTAMDKLLATEDNLIVFPSQIDGLAQNDDVDAAFSFEGDPVPSGREHGGARRFYFERDGAVDQHNDVPEIHGIVGA